jgi:aspartyl-tRNA(Asn)/glutamyl-tRNA(Gln) amidotransferase subunit A
VIDDMIRYGSIDHITALFRRRELSPVELLDAVLGRVRAVEPQLNAFITVTESLARRQAHEAERAYAAGEVTGPLAGVPVSIKDIFDIGGLCTTAGSRILHGTVAQCDSAVYRRLRDAGAVLLGKTNLLEFAYGAAHPDYGQTNNPWQPARTAGGSSGGSAASVAAGLAYGSVGTDTAGSVRCPASFCGIVGLKPTRGIIDRAGLVLLSPTLDHVGPLARTVADNRRLFDVLRAGEAPAPGRPARLSIGVVRELYEATPDREVRHSFAAALELLASVGAEVHQVSLPSVLTMWQRAIEIAGPEAAHQHAGRLPEREHDYAPWTFATLMAGHCLPTAVYRSARDAGRRFAAEVDRVLARVDLLVSPTMPSPAPLENPESGAEGVDLMARTVPFNISGHPALTVPMHPSADGMPLGLQFVGPRYGEGRLYALAEAYEEAYGGFPVP